jgi:hypothetical protein
MSDQHVRRLNRVRLEREAAKEALEKSAVHAVNHPDFYEADAVDLNRAARNADHTYYFRLTAELEGMLYRHLKDHFQSFAFDDKDGASDLLNHCRHRLSRQKTDIPADLADDVMDAIRWRNYLVHGARTAKPRAVSINEAYQYIHDLILHLPDMKGDHS